MKNRFKTQECKFDFNLLNQKILDSILEDDAEKFMDLISQNITTDSNPNQIFQLNNYKLPHILQNKPTYASVCAFFGSENCFSSICESDQIKKLDENNLSVVHFACAGGNLNILRMLEKDRFSLNERDGNFMIPSCYAAMFGHLPVIQYLWAKGAEIISFNRNNEFPNTFQVACLYGHLNIVNFLYETVFPTINEIDQKVMIYGHDKYESSSFCCACASGNVDLVEYLLKIDKFSDQINSLNYKGMSPICHACAFGSLDVIKVLLKSGKVNLHPNNRKHLPLVDAAMNGQADVIDYLTKFDNSLIFEETSGHITALHAAIINHHVDIIKMLIHKGAASKYNDQEIGDLFLLVCQYSSIETIKLFDNEFEIPYTTPIDHRFVSFTSLKPTWGDLYIQQACNLENIELASFLLTKNCNFDHLDSHENFKHDWSPFLDFLIENGLDLSRPCTNFSSPLIVEIILSGNLQRVKKMISKGFELNADLISKYDCIMYVCSKGKIDLFNFLMSFNAPIKDIGLTLKKCLSGYVRTQKQKNGGKNYLYFINKLIEMHDVDINCAAINDFMCSVIVEKALEILKIFANHDFDFTHCKLKCSFMTSKEYLPIYKFLEDHGCAFDNIICRYNDCKCHSILVSLFFDNYWSDIHPEVLEFVLKYTKEEEMYFTLNIYGNIIDNIMKKDDYKMILKVYQICNNVFFPLKTDRSLFYHWIQNSNNSSLINLVFNKK